PGLLGVLLGLPAGLLGFLLGFPGLLLRLLEGLLDLLLDLPRQLVGVVAREGGHGQREGQGHDEQSPGAHVSSRYETNLEWRGGGGQERKWGAGPDLARAPRTANGRVLLLPLGSG